MTTQAMCPPMLITTTASPLPIEDGICATATWNRFGTVVAGESEDESELEQFGSPHGVFVDDDDTVYVADCAKHRVVKWTSGSTKAKVVAGGNGQGTSDNQLDCVTSVVVDKNGTMYMCDHYNSRVQRWFKNADHGDTIIVDTQCYGLAIDNEGSLYISDQRYDRVMKWPDNQVVAGGVSNGFDLDQLNKPDHIFVDREHSVYVADSYNNRVIKWPVGAKEGIVVAGCEDPNTWCADEEADIYQLYQPTAVVVDHMSTVYAIDSNERRVVRWFKDSKSGTAIISGGWGDGTNYQAGPYDLALDRHGNLYVVDNGNSRIVKFPIDKSSCTAESN